MHDGYRDATGITNPRGTAAEDEVCGNIVTQPSIEELGKKLRGLYLDTLYIENVINVTILAMTFATVFMQVTINMFTLYIIRGR